MSAKRPKNWAGFQAAKIASINEPGLANEEVILEALAFESETKDARKFAEAMSAESVT